MNQQFRALPCSTGMKQEFGMRPPSLGVNQHLLQTQPASSMNQQYGQVQPTCPNMHVNPQFFPSHGNHAGPATQVLNRGVNPSMSSLAPNPQDPFSSMFSWDMFSANQSSSQKLHSAPQQSMSSLPASSAIHVPVTSTAQPDPFEALQRTLAKPVPAAQTQYVPKSNQQAPTQVTSSVLTPGVQTGMEISWPKMTQACIQKYAEIFIQVDYDRDGKIIGDHARNLFMSWRLPTEVIKQVLDLSDQDSDSMLSLREFCIALYLMERFREGRSLPSILPNSVMLDEALLTLAGPPTAYGSTGWSPASGAGLRPQPGLLHGAQPVPLPQPVDGSIQFNQKNANQHRNGQVTSLATTERIGSSKEKVLLDSREKLEYYRTKMQDLVLYKSRCDIRLNEITERARADKGEAELVEKIYQEKYKQVGEIHSKLTIEEASFREIQERKMELQQSAKLMEQGGSADGIQSDLEELSERCQKLSLQVKSSALIQLPPGWQAGIPEIAVIWDEEWDMFDDEGFSLDKLSMVAGASAFDADESKSPRGSPSKEGFDEPCWDNFDDINIDSLWIALC